MQSPPSAFFWTVVFGVSAWASPKTGGSGLEAGGEEDLEPQPRTHARAIGMTRDTSFRNAKGASELDWRWNLQRRYYRSEQQSVKKSSITLKLFSPVCSFPL
jgi:hypothetical protein